MFLTNEELHAMTGYKRFADQRAWLTKRGWKFEQAANGRPVVLRSYAESKLSEKDPTPIEWTPNFAAIRKAA